VIILTAEYATIPTTIPTTPQINADLAVLTFSASPMAVRNKIPATTKHTTTIQVNTTQIAVSILLPSVFKLYGDGGLYNWADAGIIDGKPKKLNKVKSNIFLDILFL